MADRSSRPVDVLVGQNIRIGRLLMGLSQTELGARIGVTFQQIQKYEMGTNRVGASRLQQIANVLGLPASALFDGAPAAGHEPAEQTPRYLLTKPHALEGLSRIAKRSRSPRRNLR